MRTNGGFITNFLYMTDNAILEIRNLTKIYGTLRAVDGVSFSIARKEIIGLLGPNGAGKTSIINMVAGLLMPDGGELKIFGMNLSERRRDIMPRMNFAAAYAQLPGNLRVEENLLIYALLYGVGNPDTTVRSLLHEFDLEEFAETRTGLLSSGEQSRVVLAKALISSPKLLLLDEPTASLDPETAHRMRDKIKNYVSKNESAVLWTSHHMNEIEDVCSRVLFISHGKVILDGKPADLVNRFKKKNLEELFIMIAREPLSVHPANCG